MSSRAVKSIARTICFENAAEICYSFMQFNVSHIWGEFGIPRPSGAYSLLCLFMFSSSFVHFLVATWTGSCLSQRWVQNTSHVIKY